MEEPFEPPAVGATFPIILNVCQHSMGYLLKHDDLNKNVEHHLGKMFYFKKWVLI